MNDNYNNINNSNNFNTNSDNFINNNSNLNSNFQTINPPNNNDNNSVETKKKNNKLILIILLVLMVIVAIFVVYKIVSNKSNNSNMDNINSNEEYEVDNEVEVRKQGHVDKNTNLTYDETGAFLLYIDEVFTIKDNKTYITGTIERGKIKVGDKVQIIGLDKEIITTTITSIEVNRKNIKTAIKGMKVAICLKGISKEDVERGQTLATPNSIVASTKFEVEFHLYSKDEYKGKLAPLFNNEKVFIIVGDIYNHLEGTITLPKNVEQVNPGENVKIIVNSEKTIAIDVGVNFKIRGTPTDPYGPPVGIGTITKVY